MTSMGPTWRGTKHCHLAELTIIRLKERALFFFSITLLSRTRDLSGRR